MNKDDVINSMFTMLTDLSNGYPWSELHISMAILREQIAACGVSLDVEEGEEE